MRGSFIVLLFFLLVSCEKQEVQLQKQTDPNATVFDADGGVLEMPNIAYGYELIIPAGTFEEETVVGYDIFYGWNTDYVDSVYATANGYGCIGFFFYPFNAELNEVCTLKCSVSTQNPNLNLSNVHIFKIADCFKPDTPVHPSGSTFYPDYGKYHEINNYTISYDSLNGETYKIFEIPVESFENFYTVYVETI